MDNQTPNSQNDWVDARLASMVPPGDWHPDSKRALAQFLKRRDSREAAGSPRWIQLSMAAAVLVFIGLVVTLLPWHALWEGTKVGKNLSTEPSKAATPAVVPEPAPLSTAPLSPAPKPPRSQPPSAAVVAAVQQDAAPAPEQEQKPVEHVGPGVTPPKVILSGEPNYTDEARQAHIQGTIVLSVIIRADGTAKVERVVQGLGYGLDEKAIEAVEKWRFVPGMKDGKPVDIQLQVTMNFKLY